MIENIAMWGGIAGLVVSLFAVVILFLTKQSINDILNKDAILFDNNFEIKKNAICVAMSLVDEVQEKGDAIKNNEEFSKRAKQCYNDLLCVLNDVRIADQFYNITLNKDSLFNEARNAQFKVLCRNDIGLRTKDSMLMKRLSQKQNNHVEYQQPVQPQPTYQQPISQTIQQPSFEQSQQTIQTQQPRPIRPVQNPQPTTTQQPRPVRPSANQTVRPVGRPPMQTASKKPTASNK